MNFAFTRIKFVLAAGALFAGCSFPASRLPPAPEPAVEIADQFAASDEAGANEPLAWWESFADPVLNQVVEAVLESNFDLVQAVARVDQARARARIADAVNLPLVNPTVGIVDFDMPTDAGIGAQLDELGLDAGLGAFGISLPERIGLSTYTFGAEFAYEVDFWGRGRNTQLAAGAEQLASESDYLSARISVLAETVRTYLELVDLRRQRELALANIDILGERESMTESRYESGLIDALDLYAVRRGLRDARAGLPQLEAGLAEAESRLWILLGGYQEDIAGLLPEALTIAGAGEPVPTGIPADLLVQRPDVAGARQRMEAARFALGARRAELLPALSLSGSIGLQATDAGDWFDPDQWIRNLSVNLLGPAIQGSRLRDTVELAEARLNEATAAYGRSVITAVNEVEAALTGLEAGRRRHEVLVSFQREAQAETELQEQRYSVGIGSYEEVLAATQIFVRAEALLSSAERDLGFARLALHRALGGAWTAEDVVYLRQSGTMSAGPLRNIATHSNE